MRLKSLLRTSTLSMVPKVMIFPVLVLIVGLGLTLSVYWQHHNSSTETDEARFDRLTERIKETIRVRINTHEQVLHGIRGLFSASRSVERAEIRQYVSAINRPHLGELGYGFIRFVKRPDLESFLQTTRADQAAEFNVKTSGNAPELYVIEFIEPLADNIPAEGLDIFQEEHRRKAAQKAVEMDHAILTEKLTLIQDQEKLPGFLLLLPIYKRELPTLTTEQRWEALLGWAYAPIRIDKLLNDVTEGAENQLDFEVFETAEGKRNQILYDADGHLKAGNEEFVQAEEFKDRRFWKQLPIHLAGRNWTLYLSTRPEFELHNETRYGWFIIVAGAVISLMGATVTWTLVSGRQRAITLAEQMTAELREENTQREKVSGALKEASRFQQGILDGAAHAIISTTPDGLIRTFNPAAEKILGYEDIEVVGKRRLVDFNDPAELVNRAITFSRELGFEIEPGMPTLVVKSQHGLVNEHEWIYHHKNGTPIQVWLSITALKDDHGELTGYLGMVVDISTRKKNEAELIQARTIAENALQEVKSQQTAMDQHAIVSITDLAGRIVYANNNFCAISGYTMPELIGQNHRIVNSKHHPDSFWKQMWHTIARGSTWSGEICNRAKDGSLYWVKSTMVPYRDAQGNIERYVSIRTDITEQKRREDELIRLREVSEEATKAKSNFLATMSHEIRTPMNGVLGFTNLLQDTALTEEQRDYVNIIHTSGQNLLTIINDILDYSKIEAGKIDLESIDYDLEQAIGESIELLASRAEEKHLAMALDYRSTVPRHFIGDPGRVRQVVLNLLSNAIKFTTAGHVLVKVSRVAALPHRPDDEGVRIEVTDTGMGIPKDKQAQLFSKFTQADSSTSRKFGGTGLGLAISKQLIELMGGEIGIQSEPGLGSTFWFTLPGATGNDKGGFDIAHSPWKNARILIVDNVLINQRVLECQLANWGLEYESVSDATSALQRLKTGVAMGNPFHIALLDHMMPGIDGEKLGATIRADTTLNSLSLVMLTSSAQRGEASRFLRNGFSAYVTKPMVKLATLQKTLDIAWTDHQSRKSGKKPTGTPTSINAPSKLLAPSQNELTNDKSIYRVLVVEDSIVNQTLARHVLTSMGCRVDIAGNGLEAIQMTNQLDYDLVFMDCHMPEMDGYESTRQIRQREQARGSKRRLPIIALTAGAMQDESKECLECGMDDVVTKPFRIQVLEQTLHKWAGAPKTATTGSAV